MMSNEKIYKIINILYRQLRNYWSDWNPEYISNQVPRAMEQMEKIIQKQHPLDYIRVER